MGYGAAVSAMKRGVATWGLDMSRGGAHALRRRPAGNSPHRWPTSASRCDVVQVLVVNAAQTEAVLFGADGEPGLDTLLRRGAVVIASATVDPALPPLWEARLAERGIHLIDGPVSGGAKKAADGQMTVMASGKPEAFAAAGAALDAIAGKVYRLGDHAGVGSTVKMVNQHLAGVHIATACEAMALGMRAGADPRAAVRGDLQLRRHELDVPEPRAAHPRRRLHAAVGVNIFVKDLGIVLDAARKLSLPAAAGGGRAPALPRHRGCGPRQRGRRGGGQVLRRARRPRAACQGLTRAERRGRDMPRFAANLSMLYNEHAFLDRFAAPRPMASTPSSTCSPTPSPAASSPAALARPRPAAGAVQRARPATGTHGERGMACLPGRDEEFRRGIEQALTYAHALRCPRVHVMAGLAPAGADRAALRATYVANLAWAAAQAATAGVDVLIEPINTRDIPGFFLNRQDQAHAIVARGRRAEPEGADGPVPLPDRRGRPGDEDRAATCPPAASATCRSPACPSATSPTSARSTTPTCSTLIDALGYSRLDRLRIPAARRGTSAGLGWFQPYQTRSITHETAHHRRRRLRRRAARAHAARPRHAGRPARSTRWCWPTSSRRRPTCWPTRASSARTGAAARAVRGARATKRFDGVFHLASAVSGECEADFDLGLRSNLDSTRALLDALRATRRGSAPARLVFSQLGRGVRPRPGRAAARAWSADDTLPAPQTSYGTQKLICEHLVADYTRKGYIDGRAARLMTVTVRPGQAQRRRRRRSSAASSASRWRAWSRSARSTPEVSHPVSSPAAHGRRPDRRLRGQPRGLRRPHSR